MKMGIAVKVISVFCKICREGKAGNPPQMLLKLKIPKTILWVVNLFFIFLLIFTVSGWQPFCALPRRDLDYRCHYLHFCWV